jgi:hypothetical protein
MGVPPHWYFQRLFDDVRYSTITQTARRQQRHRGGNRRDQARHHHWTYQKTPLVGGQWLLHDNSKYDIIVTDNKTVPEIAASGQMQPIG